MSLIWFRRNKHRFLWQALAVAIALQFIGSHAVWAMDGFGSHLTTSLAATTANPLTPEKILSLSIPETIGAIKKTSLGAQNKIIIHIQDSHVNYEAQTNILKILEHLEREISGGRDGSPSPFLIAIEGASGESQLDWFRAFPDEEVKKEVLDYFLRRGSLSPAQFFQVLNKHPVKVIGIEDPELYRKNLSLFREVYAHNEKLLGALAQLEQGLIAIRASLYNAPLRVVSEKSAAFEENKIVFAEYLSFIDDTAQNHAVKLSDLKQLNFCRQTLWLEKEISYGLLNQERAQLIQQLEKKLPQEELAELIQKSLEFKCVKLSSLEFHFFLAHLAREAGVPENATPQLTKYLNKLQVQSQIEAESLFQEVEEAQKRLKEKLFQSLEEQECERHLENLQLLRRLCKLEMSRQQLSRYLQNPTDFLAEEFLFFIEEKVSRIKLNWQLDPRIDEINQQLKTMEEFYKVALARDEALVRNTLNAMEEEGMPVAILLTGGFHTDGMMPRLASQDISTVVVTPRLTQESNP